MNPSKAEIISIFNNWLIAWNEHNLIEVMKLLHEDIVFENWTGAKVCGKNKLQWSWTPWFANHENFRFITEDLFYDELEQKMVFFWKLEWPSHLIQHKGKPEKRRGIDVIHFKDGLIVSKNTYSKTTVEIEGVKVSLEK